MKRSILATILLLAVASCAFAQAVAAPETPAILIGNTGADTRTATMPVIVTTMPPVSVTALPALATGSNAIGYVGGMPHKTPTMGQLVASTTSQSITAPADRIYVTLHNLSDTVTIWVYPAATATQGQGIPLFPESSITRYWDSTVPVAYVGADLATFTTEQAVKP